MTGVRVNYVSRKQPLAPTLFHVNNPILLLVPGPQEALSAQGN